MDLETMPRRTGGARAGRSRGRRAAVLTGLLLAAAAVAGCGGGDGKAAADSASGSTRATASATPSPGGSAPATSPAAPSASATASPPVTTPPADPSANTPAPRPTGPAQSPTPAPTPPGIAVGEPDPNGPVHPAITYRVDGSKLTVWFYGGICEKYALKADESKPGRVDVRVTVAAPMPAGQACAELAKRQTVTAELKQPLMGRAVTDLATGQPVPLESDPHVGPDPTGPEIGGK
ncbi:hypothetical protein [Kitasatospora sp. NPDC059327]|uniref:hypothetical protein n=1 Tax=Kitasatospora sp. NPDC059327 TaxID=3346803 RepID=UPI0036CC3698